VLAGDHCGRPFCRACQYIRNRQTGELLRFLVRPLAASCAAADDRWVSRLGPRNPGIPGRVVCGVLRNCKNPSQGGRAEGAVTGKGTTARSPIGAADLKPGPRGTLVGTATIAPGARPGKADINFACASTPDAVVAVSITIGPATSQSPTPQHKSPSAPPSSPRQPAPY
jgi:hypothetical protein